MEGTYQAANGVFVTIKEAYGWSGLYDVTWLDPGTGPVGSGRLSHIEVIALKRRLKRIEPTMDEICADAGYGPGEDCPL
jgi:hypothetical protein